MRELLLLLVLLLSGCVSTAPPQDDGGDESKPPEAQEGAPRGFVGGNQQIPIEELNTTEWSDTYTGIGAGPFAFNTGCDEIMDPGGPQHGGACMQLPGGSLRVHFTLTDDVSDNVGVYVRNPTDAYGFFCNSGEIVVSGHAWVMFIIQDPSNCTINGNTATPTTGTIEATIYRK